MKVVVFDYGAGNLHSLLKAVALAGVAPVTETDPVAAAGADVLVLPGVGAFEPAAARLAPGRGPIGQALRAGLPCLGICLGMQLLFDESDEGGGAGLGLLPGRVERLVAKRLPQIGWNRLEDVSDPVVANAGLVEAYYANSYVCRPAAVGSVTAWSRHEDDRFPAAVRAAATLGVQFHPEKSSAAGVRLIAAFLEGARS